VEQSASSSEHFPNLLVINPLTAVPGQILSLNIYSVDILKPRVNEWRKIYSLGDTVGEY